MSKFLDLDGLEYYTKQFKPGLANLIDNSEKNIFTTQSITETIGDCTFTNNGDGSWTTTSSGAVADRRQKALYFYIPNTVKSGKYVLSGCPEGGGSGDKTYYCLYVWDVTTNTRVSLNDIGEGLIFDWAPDYTHRYSVVIDIRTGQNPNGLTFYPMICTLDDWNISQTYQPYNKNIATQDEIIDCFQTH